MEFGLILPVFVMIAFGVIELGRVLYMSDTLAYVARDGTRFAIVRGADSDIPASAQDIEAYVRNRAIIPKPENVDVTVIYDPDNSPGSVVTVQVSYDFAFFVAPFPLDPFTITRASSMVISQ